MDLVAVRIRAIVATGRYGTLEAGDVLRTDAAFARHLVEDCGAAEYIRPPVASQPAANEVRPAAETKPVRTRKGKE